MSELSFDRTIRYEALRSQVRPGDVFAFSGTGLPSETVKIATQSEFVHVAIVHSVDLNQRQRGSILIAESHIDTSLPSVGTGKKSLGAQLQWLRDRMEQSTTPIWWAPLTTPLTTHQITKMQAWLQEIEQNQTPYDFVQAIGAGMEAMTVLNVHNPADFSALFCSELVTRALQLAQVIDPSVNASEQTPAQVMKFPCLRSPLQVLR
ncbi:MAG: hypothetical protein VKJ24_14315 [Synechococcales bacterium]|nr:hypothetical protein [Synechococcales bacterium]